MVTRSQILIRGIVQGVGFRPFVFSRASQHALRGRVLNNATGVIIDIEGSSAAIEHFIRDIRSNPPPLSIIDSIECNDNLSPINFSEFEIIESELSGERFVPISPDVATCDDCLREMFDPLDRRYRYPFINCTNCGPRFTIIDDVPYDRAQTTMRDFAMCAACRTEYEDPTNRRFHAEPIACERCGPRLSLRALNSPHSIPGNQTDAETINRTCALLASGKIVAVKGIGGFHLVCNAVAEHAVVNLRARKYREDKPFALMARSLAIIEKYCEVSAAEKRLLLSEARPIVLLQRKADCPLSSVLAPGINTLGFMLPYAPLHHLLLENCAEPLVFTSANVSDEPICFLDSDARQRLAGIADHILLHNRRIRIRSDDSVVRADDGSEMVLRRSRGFAPAPIRTTISFEKQVLACGAELKNTFCLARDNYAFISHHIGDLENLETLKSFTEGIEHFKRLFYLHPEVIAHDLHPEYLSTKYALTLSDDLPRVGVQHHHAHIASCLADNNADGDVIGVALDGLGFGTDGCLWGGEFFVANLLDAERVGHLKNVPLPGGARAIREPWRMAAVYLQRAFGDEFVKLDIELTNSLDAVAWRSIRSMIATGTNSPETSSMGRLFDAVSSLLGLRNRVNFEGQAAIELETIADNHQTSGYNFAVDENGEIDAAPVIREAVEDLLNGVSKAVVSGRFHLGVAQLIDSMALQIRERYGLTRVALSGGVFQNMILLKRTRELLKRNGFEVLTHHRVPPNDGGISLGQAVVANAKLIAGRV